jgi:hypothetical protein
VHARRQDENAIAISSLALLAAACSDETRVLPAPPGDPSAPLYMVSTSVYSGDDATGFLAPATSLEPGATFDLERAIEIPESSISAPRSEGLVLHGRQRRAGDHALDGERR